MKPDTANKALTKTLKLQACLELEGQNAVRNSSGSTCGVKHMKNFFLAKH